MNKKVIAIANDHSASEFRKPIIEYLEQAGYEVLDLGTKDSKPVDYPDFGVKIAKAIVAQKAELGIAICGTGIGISIAANRFHGVRCALVYEEETTRLARQHNNANVIALGARIISSYKAVELVKIFLDTPISSETRHQNRIKKLD
ncbi:RpiB/LacA/LacB family sugar-phosphate isomerase [Spiroplasma platyhelix]|uniref:RpiB/LacA/LacB family sugar-phosphate isomerase n=1 Tax=Spiroplasma platyhelix PALS-1 TaxID=1276218 RepID=A0A846UDR4_9MOLU|nr:RpiB/LacA/LacB family sugar-phosphate isomerase [Spiroplasma platyhelix]MBE4704265.1 putative sugar phosphate isomerase YwlF [Spiroplasma platyhelix PALS-1]NKE38638.1 RpiB/LacA/LacB family sugar-phosphate isomerase [Spiroplasma platyhelix PALS-1]UJB28849.1 ribose-5-phosphate isomerase B [Spiroplasma platyhelix PALS-1]